MAASIRAFGFVVPVLIDEKEKVLAGNAAVKAGLQLGMELIPCVVVSGLSDTQKRGLILAHNRLAELAEWNQDILQEEIISLREHDLEFDLEVIGFTGAELDAIVLGDEGGGETGDVVPDTPAVPVSRIGDLWVMGDHRLLCGDSTDADAVALLMQGHEARTVFTDPPYNVPVAGHITGSGQHGEFVMASGEMSDAEFIQFLTTVLQGLVRSTAAGGLIYFCMDWRGMEHTLAAARDAKLEFLNLLVWDKGVGGMGSFYRSRHELIFLFRKPGAPHTNRVELGKNGRNRTNVWTYEGMNGFGKGKARARAMHPTVKPLALVRDAILDSSAAGEVVLDLFSGSGTTLIAAEQSKRMGRAMELGPNYVDVGVLRWEGFSGREAVLAETGETFREVAARRLRDAAALDATPAQSASDTGEVQHV
ncbi:MAG: hypothetical protein K2X25_12240 [Caulobacteraceae bacterium]|nr:hypothetical protein [Caulobacteraceae bacterium]